MFASPLHLRIILESDMFVCNREIYFIAIPCCVTILKEDYILFIKTNHFVSEYMFIYKMAGDKNYDMLHTTHWKYVGSNE